MPRFFEVERYRVTVERRRNARGEMVTVSEAVVVARFGAERMMSVSESHDPVTQPTRARSTRSPGRWRKDLGPYQAYHRRHEAGRFPRPDHLAAAPRR